MRRNILLAVAASLLALTLAPASRAAPYMVASLKRDQMFILYTGTVERFGPYMRAWVGIFGAPPAKAEEADDLPIIKVYFEWDCNQKRHRDIGNVAIDSKLKVVDVSSNVGAWTFIAPGTIYGRMQDYICNGQRDQTVFDHADEEILANYRAALTVLK